MPEVCSKSMPASRASSVKRNGLISWVAEGLAGGLIGGGGGALTPDLPAAEEDGSPGERESQPARAARAIRAAAGRALRGRVGVVVALDIARLPSPWRGSLDQSIDDR